MKAWKAELLLFLVTFIWGATFLFTKVGLNDCPPSLFIIIRFITALILSFLFFGKQFLKVEKKVVIHGIMLGLMIGGGFLLQTYGLKYTTVSKSAFITGITVVFTPIVFSITQKSRIKSWQKAGVIIAIPGLWLFTDPHFDSINLGDFLTLISTVFWAFYITYMDVFTKNRQSISHTAQLVILQYLAAAPMAVITFFLFEYSSLYFNLSSNLILALAYNGILASFLVTFIHTGVQKYSSPVKATLIFSLEPVIASSFAMIFINEFLSFWEYIGAGILFIGVLASVGGEFALEFIRSKVRIKKESITG